MSQLQLNKYRGFIFDLDGTLIDSMPKHVLAWQEAASERGFSIEADFIYQNGGNSSANIALMLKEQGNNVGEISDFVKRKVEFYRQHIHEVALFEHISSILKEAKARGALITIGTGTQRINAEDILKIHELTQHIDFLISANDVQQHKPHPETYLKALALMGLKAEECVVFEDGQLGIAAALAAHIDCVEVQNNQIIKMHKASS